MKSSESGDRRGSGRPRSFDRDAALRQAMLTFWRHGYETSSVSDLTSAMGITAPSLYAAFGNKEQLFRECVGLYLGDAAEAGRAIEAAPSALEAARTMLTAAAEAYTGDGTPKGCLLASATASGSAASAEVQDAVADVRRAAMAQLRARVERDVADGALPAATSGETLAGLVMAVTQGMSVLARDGVPRARLLAIARAALDGWPRAALRGPPGHSEDLRRP